jgi:hypothetical protein
MGVRAHDRGIFRESYLVFCPSFVGTLQGSIFIAILDQDSISTWYEY